MGRRTRISAACLAAVLLGAALPAAGAAAAEPSARIDLRVLVVDDGGPATGAIEAELADGGTPYTTVDLTDPERPRVDEAFLTGTAGSGDGEEDRPLARYQAVVLPNDNPFGADSAEMAALAAYERRFGIKQVDAYTYARPAVGLRPAAESGYAGTLDGHTAAVTPAGAAGPFGYLEGPVPFEDNDPSVDESYGYLAAPLAEQEDGATYTSYVDAPLPGGSGRGSLVGEYARDGRRELVVTFAYDRHQLQYRLLARGIVAWMTDGVHLGGTRNHFAVHVDDVFGADDRWHTELNCTPGDVDCGPAGDTVEPDPIRMTPEDASYARTWSERSGFRLDLAYNAGGSDSHREQQDGADPLTDRLLADQDAYRWINHTYDHTFLGCEQDVTVVPWRCATDATGDVRWTGRDHITAEIAGNLDWADRNGLAVDRSELVTGEHSGLATLPQQPADNPALAPSLADTGVTWLASDNSREQAPRAAGPALTVPRHPMNVFYNAGRIAEQVDEYNWIYGRKADGGSGICETSEHTTCLDEPLDPGTGYADHIVPLEARIALSHILSGDPRPHFVHQSNLAEDRIAYPVLDRVLADYDALFTDSAPLLNPRMRDAGAELRDREAWRAARDGAAGYRVGDTVTVTTPEAGTPVPATMPAGTRTGADGGGPFGSPYAGLATGWATADGPGNTVEFTLPDGAPGTAAPEAATGRAGPLPSRVSGLPLPAGVTTPVPAGPGDDRTS
ncbi:hypothetical protein [Streptomyces zingiberis]|uniref:Uncharacterized protein n=1 Tax=Streptomyces zingiberis TaxID=2053010 RepID=A0ABX1BYE9_9ACTN|nr:hypothetical protein [Streptomyces zingiberis]NJQ02661.1 hypothetical protein [Streptomyces zingiberis]